MRDRRIKVKLDETTYYARYRSLIEYANAYRRLAQNSAALSGIAIVHIRAERAKISKSANSPALGTAYIVRQFKRPEEIELMRTVYGRKFIQVSVFGSALERREVLMDKIRRYDPSPKTDAECERLAIELIDIDHNQKDDDSEFLTFFISAMCLLTESIQRVQLEQSNGSSKRSLAIRKHLRAKTNTVCISRPLPRSDPPTSHVKWARLSLAN